MMPDQQIHAVIFTDLDGTLLDHKTYDPEPAASLVETLTSQQIAEVVPITSKTQAELRELSQQIAFSGAARITENGSVIHSPNGYPFNSKNQKETHILGEAYADILGKVDQLPHELRKHIEGFSQMDEETVAHHTGLNPGASKRAKIRDATEPFLWHGAEDQLAELKAAVAELGLELQQGGRFFHLTGKATKERAMLQVMEAFRRADPDAEHISIALGDGPNDIGMIEAADYGVIIPNPEGPSVASDLPKVRRAPTDGPRGWVASVTEILRELGLL